MTAKDQPLRPVGQMDAASAQAASMFLRPLNAAMVYLLVTLAMYFAGAYVWNVPSPAKLIAFLLAAFAGFWAGGLYGAQRRERVRRRRIARIAVDGIALLRFSCVFSIVAYVIMAYYFGEGLLLGNLAMTLGEVYLEKAARVAYERSTIVQVTSWLWGLTYLYLPIGLYLFRKLSALDRLLLTVTTTMCVWYWLSIGTVKGIGDVAIQVVVFFAVTRARERLARARLVAGGEGTSTDGDGRDWFLRSSRRRMRRLAGATVLVALLFLCAFDAVQASREVAIYGVERPTAYLPSKVAPFVVEVRDTPFPNSLETLMFYMSHGYTGLAYSLELPFKWTGLVGASRSMTELVESRLPVRVGEVTYMQRAEDTYGWDNGMLWSTIFPWIAGDVTFYGVPIVMALLGRLFTGTWRSCLREETTFNVLDLAVFAQLAILVVYIPANNQVVQSRQALFTVALLLFMRIFVKVRTAHHASVSALVT